MSDLQKRLKSYADWLVSCALGNVPEEAATAYEAVSELERLRRENDRLRERLQIDPGGGDAIDAIQAMMDERGVKRADIFPSRSRASECMSRKRPLSIDVIRKLHFEFGIPADVLIAPYTLRSERS